MGSTHLVCGVGALFEILWEESNSCSLEHFSTDGAIHIHFTREHSWEHPPVSIFPTLVSYSDPVIQAVEGFNVQHVTLVQF